MKFETINNQLCRMVEAEPLTDDVKFPCVVRLIQDDSPMGRYNQSYSEYRYGVRLGCCMLPIIATHIAKNGVVNDIEWDVSRYEIIGYPVEEGSAEWAVQRMKLGDMVCNSVQEFVGYWSIVNGYCFHAHSGHRCSPEKFLSLVNVKTGWQLYTEPQPETAKEPEIVAHKQHANCLVCGKVIEGLLDGHATVSIKRYSISSLYESTYSHYCGKCFLELGFDATERELRNRQQPIAEPEPEPKFAVGDWVTDGVVDGYIAELDNGIAQVKKYGISYSTNVEHLRKLSPSEVVLDFGSGIRGTIRRYRGEQIRIYDGDINFACLAISYVTEPMQTTVRKLLAAIEEERKKQ